MKRPDLEVAIQEAERFLVRAKALRIIDGDDLYVFGRPKEQGAVMRSSMDLTRALANLRRSE